MITAERKSFYINLIQTSSSLREVCLKAGIVDTTGNYNTLKRLIKENNIDISHFKRQNNKQQEKHDLDFYLQQGTTITSFRLKQKLLNEGKKQNICEKCGCTEWLGVPIKLELHHINGDNTDNRIENIQLLCPNCHSYTDNYGGKNQKINKKIKLKAEKRKPVDVNFLQSLLNEYDDITIVSEKIGRAPKTVLRYIKEHNLVVKEKPPKYDNEIDNMVSLMKIYRNYSRVGEILGISDNAVKKRFIRLGYPGNIKGLMNELLKEETRCLDASRIKEHQPRTAEVLRIKLVSRGNVTARKVLVKR